MRYPLKTIMVAAAASAVVIAVLVLAIVTGSEVAEQEEPRPEIATPPDIIMPTKSSRPGCEEEDLCYIPYELSVRAGETVTWTNQDAAFHSVTSGAYGEPSGMFDSGHMDPGQSFRYVFSDPGRFAYHCTLHPWMEGVVDVT